MFKIYQIPPGSNLLMVKQRLRLCITSVGESTENAFFLKFSGFMVFSRKDHIKNSSILYNMTFCMQRSMCKKVTNFKSLKVSKLMTFCKYPAERRLFTKYFLFKHLKHLQTLAHLVTLNRSRFFGRKTLNFSACLMVIFIKWFDFIGNFSIFLSTTLFSLQSVKN